MVPNNCERVVGPDLGCDARRTDTGFTIVELVIASAIFFFVATALFGLVATSTMLGVASKANAVGVNAANAFLEEVRRVPFNEVNQTRINQIASAYSRTIDGVAVSISATVTPQWFGEQDPGTANPAYMHVAVVARAVGPDGRPHTFSTGTHISNLRATGTLPGGGGGGGEPQVPPPTIELRTGMPMSGAVRGTSVPVGLSAEAGGSGVTLRRIDITAGGSLVLEKLTTELSDSVSGFWDTTRITTDGASFPDGVYEMRASARDSRNQLTARAWSLTVDNFPPNPPGQPVVDAVNSAANSVTFGWDPARDGTDWVRSYQVDWRIQSSTSSAFNMVGTPAIVTPVDWTARQVWPTANGATSPLSRYRVDVTSRGPIAEGQTTPHFTAGPVSAFFISRGSYEANVQVTNGGGNNARARFNLNLTSHTPTFSTTGVVNYRWQYRYHTDHIGTGTWTDLAGAGSSSPSFTNANWQAPQDGRFIKGEGWIEFRYLVTVTPAGGTTVQVPSSFARFSRVDNSTGPAARGADDWTRWLSPPAVTPAIDWGMWRL